MYAISLFFLVKNWLVSIVVFLSKINDGIFHIEKLDSTISWRSSLKSHPLWVTLYLKMIVVEVPIEAGAGDEGWDGGEVGEV